ncbi:MAG TPA: hypothetical protein VLD40_01530, partial [Dissulfurispiraceae bacterium]|nr:hypothetical protein [Dissulfurispiraceae bacterium]
MIDKNVPPSQDHPRGKRVKFEQLLTDLSVRFVNVPTDRVDQEIEDALKQVLEFFRADRCGLLEVSPDWKMVHLSHVSYAEGVEHVSKDIDLAGMFPWHYGKLVLEQRHVAIS